MSFRNHRRSALVQQSMMLVPRGARGSRSGDLRAGGSKPGGPQFQTKAGYEGRGPSERLRRRDGQGQGRSEGRSGTGKAAGRSGTGRSGTVRGDGQGQAMRTQCKVGDAGKVGDRQGDGTGRKGRSVQKVGDKKVGDRQRTVRDGQGDGQLGNLQAMRGLGFLSVGRSRVHDG